MSSVQLSAFLEARMGANRLWFAKRLAANDTLATRAHQAGPYFPKPVMFRLFPELERSDKKNPDVKVAANVQGEELADPIRGVWYNSKVYGGGTRNECRFTNFGGQSSPVLNEDSTGSVALFSFLMGAAGSAVDVDIWVCVDPDEDEEIESRIGEVLPGSGVFWRYSEHFLPEFIHFGTVTREASCQLPVEKIPPEWFAKFPTGVEIFDRVLSLRPCKGLNADRALIKRRNCEFQLFQSVEEATTLPLIRDGFASLDEFLSVSHTVLQRRKSRSGRSLELHLRRVFEENGLVEGDGFDHGKTSEGNKKPDFLFPSAAAYRDETFPAEKLRMLGVKTTCKDRWRQVVTEADRIAVKHLLTLQEGVSVAQFAEMRAKNIQLVVPAAHVKRFPKEIRADLQTVQSFIDETRAIFA